jgi:pyruvate/2-oxoglutarate dehydrogenase complex dihydrolipoamide acyltransferase (E2) component
MRGSLLMVTVLLLGGCSCGRQPDAESAAGTAASGQAAPAPDPAAAATSQATAMQAQAQASNAEALSQAASTVHAYLAAVAGKDWNKADAYWVGGKPPPQPDDYSVRSLQDLGSMRIDNEAPEPLDKEIPTRAVEIPVVLRARKSDGIHEIKGWYRLRRKVSDDGWEITSASMRPSLD